MKLSQDTLNAILKQQTFTMHFQPIISIAKHSVVGIEALCRANTTTGPIAADQLFSIAVEAGMTVELDRMCRNKAMEEFAKIHRSRTELVLFLNLDVSVIDKGFSESREFIDSVYALGLDPSRIVIEIIEAKVYDTPSLIRFVETYRSHGFLIAMDDMGSGYSNIERIALTKPDILKVDQSIIRDIDKKFYKQEILKALVGLAHKLGSIVVAEGIESVEEAVVCLDMGANLLQGYYFAYPQPLETTCRSSFNSQGLTVANEFKHYKLRQVDRKQAKQREIKQVLHSWVDQFSGLSREEMRARLQAVVDTSPLIECGYLLDTRGVQISETIFNQVKNMNVGKQIFRPATPGQDHSAKEYYYLLSASGYQAYITTPYISWATGNLCVTATQIITDNHQGNLILCLDVLYQGM